MSRKGTFTYNETERKQLEEISHLYFSTPSAPQNPQVASPQTPVPATQTHLPPTQEEVREGRAFTVECSAGRGNRFLASQFLFHISLLLRLSGEEVLLLCSREAFRERFAFGFRPDRERAVRVAGVQTPGRLGPLGVCLLECDGLTGVRPTHARRDVAALPGLRAFFDYILADRFLAAPSQQGLTLLTLLVVTHETPEDAFRELDSVERVQDRDSPRSGGIVVGGVQDKEEAGLAYSCWRDRLEHLFPGRYSWESYGMFPGSARAEAGRFASGMSVLERPTCLKAKCLLETVSLIRRNKEYGRIHSDARVAGHASAGGV